MPQKKNLDSLELLRGTSGRAFGQITGLMMIIEVIFDILNPIHLRYLEADFHRDSPSYITTALVS
jgi:hypothetical protein